MWSGKSSSKDLICCCPVILFSWPGQVFYESDVICHSKTSILHCLPYLKIKKIASQRRQTCNPLIISGQHLAIFGRSACPLTVRRFLHSLPWMMARNVVFYTNKVWRIAVKHTGGLSLGLLLPSCRPLFCASLLPPYRAVGTYREKGQYRGPSLHYIRVKGGGGYY